MERIKTYIPTPSLLVLLLIGLLDLITTAFWHSKGQITESNPVMRLYIEHSEWLFAAVKGGILIAAYFVMAYYAQKNLAFVRTASRVGVILYIGIYVCWVTANMSHVM